MSGFERSNHYTFLMHMSAAFNIEKPYYAGLSLIETAWNSEFGSEDYYSSRVHKWRLVSMYTELFDAVSNMYDIVREDFAIVSLNHADREVYKIMQHEYDITWFKPPIVFRDDVEMEGSYRSFEADTRNWNKWL